MPYDPLRNPFAGFSVLPSGPCLNWYTLANADFNGVELPVYARRIRVEFAASAPAVVTIRAVPLGAIDDADFIDLDFAATGNLDFGIRRIIAINEADSIPPDLSTAGYVIGTLTLNRTPVGATTFSEVSDPDSKFTVVGSELRLSASVNHAVAKSHRYQGSRLTRRPAAGRWLNPIPCLPIPSLLLRLIALKSCSLFKGFPCQTLMKS